MTSVHRSAKPVPTHEVRRTRRSGALRFVRYQYAHEFIEQSAIAYFKDYLNRIRSGEIAHAARGDADIRQRAFIAG
jgi:hypothetical protein